MAQKISKWKIGTTWFSNITFHVMPFWLQTLVVINSESCWFMPEFILKLLLTAIWNCSAVWLKTEQIQCTGSQFRSAALHRILFRKFQCSCVPMPCFDSETVRDQWMMERLSNTMSTALLSNNILYNLLKFHFTYKHKICCQWFLLTYHCQKFTKHIFFWLLN